MDSKHNGRLTILAFAATLLSGAAFYFGGGLHPHWWLTWVAALPVLLLAPSLPWGWSLLVAFAANALGALSFWNYLRQYLQFPLSAIAVYLFVPGAAIALAVLLFRGFFRRGQVWLAVLAFPSLIVAYEYLTELALGTFGNTAYTQLNNPPALQLAAIAGMWGIGFVVMLFAPAVAAAILSRGATRRKLALMLAGVLMCVYGYGAWRLRSTPPAAQRIVVGLVSTQFPKNIFPASDAQKMQLLKDYAAQASALAARGAKIVVLPEMTVRVSPSLSEEANHLFEQTARESGAQVLLGVLNQTSSGAFNEARLYLPSGAIGAVYRKRHLVPVAEAGTTPVKDYSVLDQPEGTTGIAICRDMDYPNPARTYGEDRVGLLLVPAWDFDVDRWWHGHMALMRGVEYGYSIVRSAKVGFLTVSDDRGRVLAEASTTPQAPFTSLLATVPVRHDWTLYQALGDWFAWLNLALLCGLALFRFLGRREIRLNERNARSDLAGTVPMSDAR
jgi:apolipoprotein N-acyltransferase